jgi:hypothetical protein
VIEGLVWADIESFLLRTEEILERLKEHLLLQDRERPLRKKELAKLTAQRQQKVAERDRILALFRRGRIDEQVLDQQLDLIQNETATLQEQIDSASRALAIPDRAARWRPPLSSYRISDSNFTSNRSRRNCSVG